MKREHERMGCRIAIVLPCMGGGGAERVTIQIANAFVMRGCEVDVLYVKHDSLLVPHFHRKVKAICLNEKRVRSAWFKLLMHFWKFRYDVVFAIDGTVGVTLALLRWLLPYEARFVFRECNIPSLYYESKKNGRLLLRLYAVLVRYYDAIICQSNDMKRDFGKWRIRENGIVVIHNPVDVKAIKGATALRPRPGCSERKALLAVGSLRHRKGHDRIISAFAGLRNVNCRLMILGEGEELARLRRLASDLGVHKDVEFLGFKENRYAYMKSSNLYLLGSRYEGFPNSLIEALACGLPAVAFRCKGGIDEVIQNGVNGFAVEDGNVEQFSRRIEDALSHGFDRREISESALTRFNSDRIIDLYDSVLRNPLPE